MYAKIGRITPATGGTNILRGDYLGGLITATAGDYKDVTLAGRMYFAYHASSAMALYTATAAIGIQIYNPVGSGVNLVIHKWSFIVWASSATMTGAVLAVADAKTAAPASPVAPTANGKTFISGSSGFGAGICTVSNTCTLLAAPVIVWPLFHNTAGIAIVGAEKMDGGLQGSIGFAPGTVAVFGALGAAGVTITQAVTYEEVPLGL
jgi:hypothetical protein